MAGMGPPPNPNARRRNKPDAGFEVLAKRDGEVPELGDGDWHPATRAAWIAWWQSPQASKWDASDLPSVMLMAVCYNGAVEGNKESATEFRQWADRFGLSTLARLRNRWTIASDAEAAADAAESTVGAVVQLRAAK